jgi:hypothetical protein
VTSNQPVRGKIVRSTFRPLVAIAVAGMVAVGCSNGSGESTTGTSAANYEQALKFSKCMRSHGLPDFPDPDASGDTTVDGIVNGSTLDPESSGWKRAVAACEDLQPPGFTGTKRTAEQQAASLEFAQCIRENGVQDFPDPDPNGPLIDTNRIPSLAGGGSLSMLNAAMQTCGARFGDRIGVTTP